MAAILNKKSRTEISRVENNGNLVKLKLPLPRQLILQVYSPKCRMKNVFYPIQNYNQLLPCLIWDYK